MTARNAVLIALTLCLWVAPVTAQENVPVVDPPATGQAVESPQEVPPVEVQAASAEGTGTGAEVAATATEVGAGAESAAEAEDGDSVSAGEAGKAPSEEEKTLGWRVDQQFGVVVSKIAPVLFFEVPLYQGEGTDGTTEWRGIPLIVLVLLLGALFFTFYHRFINFRGFRHAVAVTAGRYDNPDDPGEISHFQALTSALSATIGLGNIAGVAVAVGTGGPGAVFWMALIGFFGMSAKFHECTLSQLYRKVDADGTVHGGPMYYLSQGLKERNFPVLGKVLAVTFAIFCIGGSFGGGNMFQANQSFAAMNGMLQDMGAQPGESVSWIFGFAMAFLVGLVIIGGIKRIGTVTEKIIPFMSVLYVAAGFVVLFTHASAVPAAVGQIFSEAFSMKAGIGGLIGVCVIGIKRAVFSNEAGIGSAAIAHAAAKTDFPVREGLVASLGPFIDTIVICMMTALVLVVTGANTTPGAGEGVEMTRWAFGQAISWFPYVLAICILLFAYSTMISWSYYGEKAWAYLFGRGKGVQLAYRVTFLVFVVLGSVAKLSNVIDFSDLMILSMAFPNIIGGVILAPKVKRALMKYWKSYQNNEFKEYR